MAEIEQPQQHPSENTASPSEQRESPQVAPTPIEHPTEAYPENSTGEIREVIKTAPVTTVSSPTTQQTYSQIDDTKVENLLKVALQKGLDEAIKEAKKTKSPYIMDQLHDALVDKLREQLREKGKLKEI